MTREDYEDLSYMLFESLSELNPCTSCKMADICKACCPKANQFGLNMQFLDVATEVVRNELFSKRKVE